LVREEAGIPSRNGDEVDEYPRDSINAAEVASVPVGLASHFAQEEGKEGLAAPVV
jgi:hypothetical protein